MGLSWAGWWLGLILKVFFNLMFYGQMWETGHEPHRYVCPLEKGRTSLYRPTQKATASSSLSHRCGKGTAKEKGDTKKGSEVCLRSSWSFGPRECRINKRYPIHCTQHRMPVLHENCWFCFSPIRKSEFNVGLAPAFVHMLAELTQTAGEGAGKQGLLLLIHSSSEGMGKVHPTGPIFCLCLQ